MLILSRHCSTNKVARMFKIIPSIVHQLICSKSNAPPHALLRDGRAGGSPRPPGVENQNNALRTRTRLTRAVPVVADYENISSHTCIVRDTGRCSDTRPCSAPKTLSIQLGQQKKGIMGVGRWRNVLAWHDRAIVGCEVQFYSSNRLVWRRIFIKKKFLLVSTIWPQLNADP